MAPVGGAPSIDSRTHDDFNNEASVLHSEQTLYSNPSMSNVHTIIYSLFTISCRLSGGTVLTAPRTPYDRFPYGLTSPVDACARRLRGTLSPSPSHLNSWEWQAMLLSLAMNSRLTRERATVPASATWHPTTVRPGSALWQTLRDSHRWLWSLCRLTPL